MEYPLISVVVPVYNAGEFLTECVQSILEQDYPSIEIVLVNDGSTDGSKEVCDQFAAEHSKCKVVHQANQGVSKARANGVKAATGTYISFVDADDTLPATALSHLYSGISSEQTQLVIGQLDETTVLPTAFATVKEYRKAFVTGQLFSAPFAKLIHRSLFNEKTFDVPRQLTIGEDLIINLRLSHQLITPPI